MYVRGAPKNHLVKSVTLSTIYVCLVERQEKNIIVPGIWRYVHSGCRQDIHSLAMNPAM